MSTGLGYLFIYSILQLFLCVSLKHTYMCMDAYMYVRVRGPNETTYAYVSKNPIQYGHAHMHANSCISRIILLLH